MEMASRLAASQRQLTALAACRAVLFVEFRARGSADIGREWPILLAFASHLFRIFNAPGAQRPLAVGAAGSLLVSAA
jgi:hypothetical protein